MKEPTILNGILERSTHLSKRIGEAPFPGLESRPECGACACFLPGDSRSRAASDAGSAGGTIPLTRQEIDICELPGSARHTGDETVAPGTLRLARALIFLAPFWALAVATASFSVFVDEGDTLALGRFLSEGRVLYRDLFSHHFPFPYYWCAALFPILGTSTVAYRVSLLAVGLAAFLSAIALSRRSVPLIVAGAAWFVIAPFCAGHMVVYPTFAGYALVILVALALDGLVGRAQWGSAHGVAAASGSVVAVLSDPTTAPTVAAAIAAILVCRPPRRTVVAGVVSAACLLAVWLGYLGLTGSGAAFLSDAVGFNLSVYSKYRAGWGLLPSSLMGLDLTDSSFPIVHVGIPFADTVPGEPLFDRSLFTGVLFRLCGVAAVVLLLSVRKPAAAFFAGFIPLSLILSGHAFNFHGIPFALVSLLLAGHVTTGNWTVSSTFGTRQRLVSGIAQWTVRLGVVGLTLMCLVQVARRPAQYLASPYLKGEAEQARLLSGIPARPAQARLAVIPAGTYAQFLTGMQPLTRFIFFWPWVLDRYEDEIKTSLTSEAALVVVNPPGGVGGPTFARRLADLEELCKHRLCSLGPRLYVSPRLALAAPYKGARVCGGSARIER